MLRVSLSHRPVSPSPYILWTEKERDSKTAKLWNTPRAPILPFVRYPHLSQITSIQTKSSQIFTSSIDGTIRKWSVPSELYDPSYSGEIHIDPEYILAVGDQRINDFAVLGSGKENGSFAYGNGLERDIVISVSDDELIRVFEVYNDFCALEDDTNMLTDTETYVKVPPDKSGNDRVKVRVFETSNRPPVFGPCSSLQAHGDSIKCLSTAEEHSADEKTVKNLRARYFVTGSFDGTLALFDANALKPGGLCCGWCLGRCQVCSREMAVQNALVHRWPHLARSDRRHRTSGDVFEPVSRLRHRTFNAGPSGVFSVCLKENSSRVAAGLGDGTIVLWDTKSKKSTVRLKGAHSDVVRAIEIVGSKMVSASSDCSVAIWDLRVMSGRPLTTFEHHVDSVMCLHTYTETNAERNASVLSGGRDGLVLSFELDGRSTDLRSHASEVAAVCTHSSGVSAIAQSGPAIFTGCEDGLLTCWIPDEKVDVSRPLTNAFLNSAKLRGEDASEFSRIVGVKRSHSPLFSILPPPSVRETEALGSRIHQKVTYSDGICMTKNILNGQSLPGDESTQDEIPTKAFFEQSISSGQITIELKEWKNGITDWHTFRKGHMHHPGVMQISTNNLVNVGLLILVIIFRDDFSDLSDELKLQLSLLKSSDWWITLTHETGSVSAWLPQLERCVGVKERLIAFLTDQDAAEAIRQPMAYRVPQAAHGLTVQIRPRKGAGMPAVDRDIITISRFSSPTAVQRFIAKELGNRITMKSSNEILIYKDDKLLQNDVRFGTFKIQEKSLLILEYGKR